MNRMTYILKLQWTRENYGKQTKTPSVYYDLNISEQNHSVRTRDWRKSEIHAHSVLWKAWGFF